MRVAIVLSLSLALAAAAAAAAAKLPVPSEPGMSTAAVALSAPVYVLSGGGYGHGVGLNQYGALGQARANRGYREILGFYYPGTELGKAPIAKVRVLVADGRPSVRLASVVPFSVRDGSGLVTRLPAGEIVLTPDLELVVDGTAKPLPAPLSFIPGKGETLTLDGKGYRGELTATVVQAIPHRTLQIIDVVGLDGYLLGVVSGEMPKEWPAAALQAQAVAARSYALAGIVKNRPFDLYSDTRSQMYYGVSAESPATTAAVKATRGEILTYGGKVATTYYYSSSGGRTASSEDVFGVVTPYLRARDDPWDALSPYHRWTARSYTAASLGQAFGLSAPVVDVEVVPTASGRPASVTLVKRTGARVLLLAADVRARLGLRSTAFRLGVLRVARVPAATPAGTQVVVSGLARDVQGPLLEKLGVTGTWLPSVKIMPEEDGSFGVIVRPKATATYRLTAEGQIGPALTVTVAPGAVGAAK
jgi:stage II sporulation protein D